MSFISERRLFRNPLNLSMWTGYIFDLLALVALWSVIARSIPELRRFASGATHVVADPAAIAMIGFLGLYGVRISTYVAMIRHNRAPQIIEWWCMLAGLAIPLTFWLLDDTLLKSYAALHGYHFCQKTGGGSVADFLFAYHGRSCAAD